MNSPSVASSSNACPLPSMMASKAADDEGGSLQQPSFRFELEDWANEQAGVDDTDGSPAAKAEEEAETAWLRATRASARAPRAFGKGRGLLFRRGGGGAVGGGGPRHAALSSSSLSLPAKPKFRHHERGYRAMVDDCTSSSSFLSSTEEDTSHSRSNSRNDWSLFTSTSTNLGSSGTLPEEEVEEPLDAPPPAKEPSSVLPQGGAPDGNAENFLNHRRPSEGGLRRANSQPMERAAAVSAAASATPTAAERIPAVRRRSAAASSDRCRISPPPRVRLHRRNSTMSSFGNYNAHDGHPFPSLSSVPSFLHSSAPLEDLDSRACRPPPLPPPRPRRANTYSGFPSSLSSSHFPSRRDRTASSSSFEEYLGLATSQSSPPSSHGDWSWPEELVEGGLENEPLVAEEELEGQRERKKIRALCKPTDARVPPLAALPVPSTLHQRGNRSCSDLLRQSKHEWDQIELAHSSSSPPLANLFRSESPLDDGPQPHLQLQPPPSPARSVASLSRKRGVAGGSPLGFSSSDWDDWSGGAGSGAMDASNNSSSSFNHHLHQSTTVRPRTRSRSRIYSPDAVSHPSLPPPHPNRFRTSPSPDPIAARDNVMDIDSDDDDEDIESKSHDAFLDGSDRDSSFESSSREPSSQSFHGIARHGPKQPQVPLRLVETEQDVLESMPSYDDLKFVILALRHQSRARINFNCASWQLCPRLKWEPSRRAGLIQWATRHLGFTLRAVGGSHSYLQISKARGTDLLLKLEQSRTLYKQIEQPDAAAMSAKCRSLAIFSEAVNDGPVVSMDVSRSHQRSNSSPCFPTMVPSYVFADEVTSDLVAQMKSLAVVDGPKRLSSSSSTLPKPPPRYVTVDQPAHLTPRPSLDAPPPRPSFDAPPLKSGDILFQLQGRSPVVEDDNGCGDLLPPRLSSLSARRSTGLPAAFHRTSAPFATAASIGAATSFDVLETPLMKQDDCWGSCPIDGRDWGGSSRCQEVTLSELMEKFQKSCQLAGPEPRDSMEVVGPPIPLATELSCSQLQFDVEEEAVEDEAVEDDAELEPELDVLMPAASQRITFQDPETLEKETRRKRLSIEMYRRRSVYYAASQSEDTELIRPSGLFKPRAIPQSEEPGVVLRTVEATGRSKPQVIVPDPALPILIDETVLSCIFAFLNETELVRSASQVCTTWADVAASAHANLMFASIRFTDDHEDDEPRRDDVQASQNPIAASTERDWQYLNSRYPWGQYLSEGGMKRVYKVYNQAAEAEEAISVMDVDSIIDKRMLGAELAVSCLLSSFPRRGICPNFVITRGVFTCPYDAPSSLWGSAENKRPQGDFYDPSRKYKKPKVPGSKHRGLYQYIRMEFCNCGDVEGYIKTQDDGLLAPCVAQGILFQMAFGLHAAADRYSVKHYDIKLLNIFLQKLSVSRGELVLRYGLGSHFFAVRMPSEAALIAKIADYGTADIKPTSNGQPVTIAQFTTLENTPPDYIILGDVATQGHGHDSFALGLCMIHLFTGHEPYEEILKSVKCPPVLKRKLRDIFEDQDAHGYHTIRSVILQDVYQDEAGHILEGEPDMTLYDTFYRYLVLFGIPEEKFDRVRCPLVWNAVEEALEGKVLGGRLRSQAAKRKNAPDGPQFARDQKNYSIRQGKNKYIARARNALEQVPGGLDLLWHLCSFDPSKRASAMDVLNSTFMENLREPLCDGATEAVSALCRHEDTVYTYAAFSTRR